MGPTTAAVYHLAVNVNTQGIKNEAVKFIAPAIVIVIGLVVMFRSTRRDIPGSAGIIAHMILGLIVVLGGAAMMGLAATGVHTFFS